MKKLFYLVSLVLFFSTSCDYIKSDGDLSERQSYISTETTIIIDTTTEKQFSESLNETITSSRSSESVTDNELSFTLYDEKIENFVNKFVTDYTDTLSGNNNQEQSISKTEFDVFDLSTEGALITQYRDHNQVLLRVKADIYGERGQSHYDIFILDDSYYVSVLTEYYSCYVFSLVDGDIIDRELNKYIVKDGVTYLMDCNNKILIETDQDILKSFMDYLQGYFAYEEKTYISLNLYCNYLYFMLQ
jgi:hypothetical protein